MRTPKSLRLPRASTSILAMATVLAVGASPAAAQSFQGTGTITTNTGGAANINGVGNTTTITLNPGQTVIDWTPTDNAVNNGATINFQPSGTTALFTADGGFAVLNKINTNDITRPIGLNGSIGAFSTGGGSTSVYFYSPGGFVVGASAVINVGSLVFSASPIQLGQNGDFITGSDNLVVFDQTLNPNASITTAAGSTIVGSAQGSYVAMVAPRVVHNGSITVNGQAALVGAEAATISFKTDGLFDIQVTSGTTDANGVVVNGDINGTASSGFGDNRRIYMVAVPKNQAMTMVIGAGANLGFDIAGAAQVDGNTIVLSAGRDVGFGSATGSTSAPGTGLSSISVTGLNATSTLRASATDRVTVFSGAGQSSTYAGNLELYAGNTAELVSSGSGASIAVTGNLFVNTDDYGEFGIGNAATGGTSRLIAQNGGSISVDGYADISASGYGGGAFDTGQSGGDGTGGSVLVQATSGGDVSILGTLYARADGYGGDAYGDIAQGGIGQGGNVTVQASGAGSSIALDSAALVSANGNGGSGGGEGCFGCGSLGNSGLGGTAIFGTGSGAGASLTVDGSAFVTANGNGGYGDTDGGDALGGYSSVTFGAGSTLQFNSDLVVEARGFGGSGSFGDGGNGTGGRVSIGSQTAAIGGSLTVAGLATANASGDGGSAYGAGTGGDGIGGQTDNGGSAGTISFLDGFTGLVQGQGGYSEAGTGGNGQGGIGWLDAFGATISVTGDYLLSASAFGGDGATGGNAIGGSAYLPSSSTHTVTGNASVLANGTGGSGFAGAGGNGTGGLANVRATGSGTLTVTGDVLAEATGNGATSYGSGALANGGNGLGGGVYVQAGNGGTLDLGSLIARANGWGGASFDAASQAGSGTGGRAELAAYGGSTIIIGGDAAVQAFGSGNDTIDCTFCGGFGGDGFGGDAFFQTYGGGTNDITVSGNLTVDASGSGSQGTGGASGNGTGGFASFQQNTAGTIIVDGLASVRAVGSGGNHFQTGGIAGAGTGGTAQIIASGGGSTHLDGGATADARGIGGDSPFGIGGAGTGGFAGLNSFGVGTMTVNGFFSADASAKGGDGVVGGDAQGGGINDPDNGISDPGAYIYAANGTITIDGSATLLATAQGGNGSNGGQGGNATGGFVSVLANSSNNGPSLISITGIESNLYADGSAFGGQGGAGVAGDTGGDGGAGGFGTGGKIGIVGTAGNGALIIDSVTALAQGFGGDGGDGGSGITGMGGNGGAGGDGSGGDIQFGTASGIQAAGSNLGSASFGFVSADSSGTGGKGGDGAGSSNSAGNGNGGNGGNAAAGGTTLLVRGSLVQADIVEMTTNATGGNGGLGYDDGIAVSGVDGIGGDASIGSPNGYGFVAGPSVVVTSRYLIPSQRGTLNAGDISATAIVTGGSGSVGGQSLHYGAIDLVSAINSELTIDSLTMDILVDTIAPAALPDIIRLVNSTANVTNNMDVATGNNLSVFLDNSTLGADSLSLVAPNFVFSADGIAPTLPGDIIVGTIDVTTQQDIVIEANIQSANAINFVAPGSITLYDVDSGSSGLSLDAQGGDVNANNLTGGTVDLYALGAIDVGNISSTDYVEVYANDTATLGTVDAASSIDIFGGNGVLTGDLTGGTNVSAYSYNGPVTVGAISGDSVNIYSYGGSVGTGNIDFNTYAYLYSNADIDTGIVTGGGDFSAYANANLTFTSIAIDGTAYLTSGDDINGGDVSAANIFASAGQDFASDGGSIFLGDLIADFDIDLLAQTDIMIGNAIAGNDIDLETSGYNDEIGGDILANNLTAGGSVGVDAGGLINVADVSAGLVNPSSDPLAEYNIGLLAGTTLTAGNLSSANSIGVAAPGVISTGNVDAVNIFMALGGDDMSFDSIDAGSNVYLANFSMMPLGGSLGPNNNFDPSPILAATPVASGGDVAIGGPVNAGIFQAAAGGAFSAQDIVSADLLSVVSSGNATTGDLTAATDIDLRIGGTLSTGDVDGGGAVDLRSVGALNAGNVMSGGFLFIGSNASISTDNLASGADILTRTDGNASFGAVDAALGIDLGAHGSLTAGSITSGESIRLGADGALNADDLTAGNSVVATSFSSITLGDISAGIVNPSSDSGALYEVALLTSGGLSVGTINALGDVQLLGTASVSTGNITTDSRLFALSDGPIIVGDLAIDQRILLGGRAMFAFTGDLTGAFDARPTFASAPVAVGGDITIGDVATNDLSLVALGNITTGDITTGGPILLDAGGDIFAGSLQSLFSSIGLFAGGDITAQDLTAATSITVDSGGVVQLGDVAAGVATILQRIGTQNIGPGNPVEIFGASIATGDISTDGYVGLYTAGSISTGTITALHDIIALAGGNASFGAISTDESFTLAGYGNFAALNTPQGGFDPSLLFTLGSLSSTGGNANFTGSSTAQSFRSFVGGNTTIASVASGSYALFDSGGLISVTGAISAPDYVGLTSSDIDIANGASVDADAIGFLSASSAGTFLGDNLGGTGGYRLNQAEIDRTTALAYEFEVSTDRGAAASMLIGDLTLDMTGSSNGDVAEFWIGNNQTGISSGTIRVVGDALFRVTPNQQVSFEATTFELDAATGSLSLLDGQNNLSGLLGLYAQNIFVASGDILTKLEADPRYAGYVEELNAPALVQRPEGVLRAASIDIDSFNGPIQNIIVQNTGTADLPAGFLVTNADIGGGEFFPEPGSVNLVINGQIVTETGTLTGIAVRDLLVSEFGSEGFVAGSTINGCLLVGACGAAGPEVLPPTINLTPTQIAILTGDPLGESDFGNEPDIDDSIDGDSAGDASSPIEAPQPLFDTRPLTDEGLIDDPISGAGNPSLYGVHSDDDDDDDDDETDAKANVKKGDGK